MLPPHIFYAEIVDHEGEGDGARDMLEKAGGVPYLKISRGGQALLEELVRESLRLG